MEETQERGREGKGEVKERKEGKDNNGGTTCIG